MNNDSADRLQSLAVTQVAVFSALRERLAHEVSSSALLADLLERVTLMQQAHAAPEVFRRQFYEFVLRAKDHVEVVRPFFPALVLFLPRHPAVGYGEEPNLSEALEGSGKTAGSL